MQRSLTRRWTLLLAAAAGLSGSPCQATDESEKCKRGYEHLSGDALGPSTPDSEAAFLDALSDSQPRRDSSQSETPSPAEDPGEMSLMEIFGVKEPAGAAKKKPSLNASQEEEQFLDRLLAKPKTPAPDPEDEPEETRSLLEIFGVVPAPTDKTNRPYDPKAPVNPRTFHSETPDSPNPFRTELEPWLGAGGRFGYSFSEPPTGKGWENYETAVPGALADAATRSYPFGGKDASPRIANFWESVKAGKIQLLAKHQGKLHDSGKFEAPVAVMFDPARDEYILAQAGNFQFLKRSSQPLLATEGRLVLHRGVGNQTSMPIQRVPQDDAGRADYLRYRGLRNWFVHSHADLAFSFPYYGSGRLETNHVILPVDKLTQFDDFAAPWVPGRHAASARNKLEVLPDNDGNRFTPERELAELRFGPNVISISTPVTNVRFTSEWNTEKEFQLIEPEDLSPVPESNQVNIAYAALEIAGPVSESAKAKEKKKVRVRSRGQSQAYGQ